MKPYRLVANLNVIVRASDNACIPLDSDNRDYAEFLEWVAHGNEPDLAEGSEG